MVGTGGIATPVKNDVLSSAKLRSNELGDRLEHDPKYDRTPVLVDPEFTVQPGSLYWPVEAKPRACETNTERMTADLGYCLSTSLAQCMIDTRAAANAVRTLMNSDREKVVVGRRWQGSSDSTRIGDVVRVSKVPVDGGMRTNEALTIQQLHTNKNIS